MFNTAKSFGKFLVTPQPQSPLMAGISIATAAIAATSMAVGVYKDIQMIKHEEQMARDCAK